jgi:hypothetical protein
MTEVISARAQELTARRLAARAGVAAFLYILVLSGCRAPAASQQRHLAADTTWIPGLHIGSGPSDTTLISVAQIVADSTGLYVADFTPGRILHFCHDGRLLWSVGRKGGGPGEFREPRVMELDGDGRLWVLDSGNRRIVKIGHDGTILERIRLEDVDPEKIIPLPHGEAMIRTRAGLPFAHLDSTGHVLDESPLPWPDLAAMNRMATQTVTAVDPATGQWFAAFSIGDGFVPFSGARWSGYRGQYVEAVPFPEIKVTRTTSGNRTVTNTGFGERPTFAARSATVSPERLYLLFDGATDRAGRLVDSYDRTDGHYVESYVLPDKAQYIAWYSGGLYVYRDDPYPQVTYLKPSDGELP